MKKTLGFATTSGQDYEVFLSCLTFLRALRLTSGDFFLVSNHAQAGKFDDVVLFYRLKGDQGPEYRAILLQAKHRDKFKKNKLTLSYPFSLKDYLESFKVVKKLAEQPVNVGSRSIELQEFSLILYTNTGCEIGEAAVDVTDLPQVQHLKNFVNTGGRLLRISEAQRVKLPGGEETSDFLSHLILCTDQTGVDKADQFLEEELHSVLKVTSQGVVSKLTCELKRVVRDWWREGTVRYLTPWCDERKKVMEKEVRRLNGDTLNIDQKLNLEFSEASLVQLEVVHRRVKKSWIYVTDEHHANAMRSRLLRAQMNSLVIGVKTLDDHWEEVEALWGSNICSTLVIDIVNSTPEEGSRLLEAVVQSDAAGRRLVVIAKGKPTTSEGWRVVDAEPTWSVLQQVSRDRLLEAPVRLQGQTATLRNVVGAHLQSDVMTEQVINSVCVRETAINLGRAMPAPLEYYVPRCLERKASKTINYKSYEKTKSLLFSDSGYMPLNDFTRGIITVGKSNINTDSKIMHTTFVEGMNKDSDIRRLCYSLRVPGIREEKGLEGIASKVTEFIPFTWTCEEEKIVVIEGPPGVGKSSFVTQMCYTVKQQFPEAWVLRLDMGKHTNYIKETDLRKVSNIKKLLTKSLSKEPNEAERRLLEHSLTAKGNVFLFLDAFDEISPDYTSKCCHLLKIIAETIRFRQMVVTTRPVTTEDVEEALGTKAFTLPVFSVQEQRLFLKQFSAAKGKPVGEEEISSLLQSAGAVLEIPLLCKMASEIMLHIREQLFLQFLNPWRRVLLYKLFVEQSIKQRVAEKHELDITSPALKMILDSNQKQHLENLQGLAVRKLWPLDQLLPLPLSMETPEEKFGLVVKTGGGVDFEHKTFAEYFLGCWLACHWKQCPRKLLRDLLLRDGFEFVAVTLSWSLFDGYPLHLAAAQADEDAVRDHLSAAAAGTRDRGGRSALHVAAMTQGSHREVWKLLVASGEDLNRKDEVLGTTALQCAEISANWEFVESVLEEEDTVGNLKQNSNINAGLKILKYGMTNDSTMLCKYILRTNTSYIHNFDDEGNSLLHLAAADNSCGVMEILINKGHKLNVISKNRLTPLHEAARRGHEQAVRLLLDNGADFNIGDKYNNTPLSLASDQGHLTVVNILLDKISDLNIQNKNGDTALTLAALNGHLDVVKVLLHKGSHVNIKNKYGYTALMWAASKGLLDVVKVLLDKESDVNIKDEDGYTALMWAASKGHLDVVKVLLDKESDVNIKNDNGNMTLTWAASEGHLHVVKVLLDKGADVNIKDEDGYSVLMLAASKGHLNVVKVLLDKGADVNMKTDKGKTALMLASREGHLDVVKVLLNKGSDVNVKNEYGHTELMAAASEGHLDVVKVLLEKGADVNIKNEYGNTALMWAAYEGHLHVVKVLLDKGSDVNIKDEDGYTALMWAASEGHLDVVKVLLDKGSDINIKNEYGNTALMAASFNGHLDVVKVLLDKGSDFNIKNEDGDTALTRAASKGHLDVVKVLLDKGSDVNIKNEKGESAMSLASLGGHLEVVTFLSALT